MILSRPDLSKYLALTGGILLPLLETIRRFEQMSDPAMFLAWFDDYLIGGFLLYAWWRTRRSPTSGRYYLCAAWGAASTMMMLSFLSQVQKIGQPDPAPVPASVVLLVKGLLLAGALTGLFTALKGSVEKG